MSSGACEFGLDRHVLGFFGGIPRTLVRARPLYFYRRAYLIGDMGGTMPLGPRSDQWYRERITCGDIVTVPRQRAVEDVAVVAMSSEAHQALNSALGKKWSRGLAYVRVCAGKSKRTGFAGVVLSDIADEYFEWLRKDLEHATDRLISDVLRGGEPRTASLAAHLAKIGLHCAPPMDTVRRIKMGVRFVAALELSGRENMPAVMEGIRQSVGLSTVTKLEELAEAYRRKLMRSSA